VLAKFNRIVDPPSHFVFHPLRGFVAFHRAVSPHDPFPFLDGLPSVPLAWPGLVGDPVERHFEVVEVTVSPLGA